MLCARYDAGQSHTAKAAPRPDRQFSGRTDGGWFATTSRRSAAPAGDWCFRSPISSRWPTRCPIAEFGMFATASAAGVMLSRILAFGFISALYRTATIRPNLIGTFTAGFLLLGVVSLPVLAAGLIRRLPDLLRQHRAAVGLCSDRLCRGAVVAAGRGGADRQQRARQIRPRRRAVDRGHGIPRAWRRAVHFFLLSGEHSVWVWSLFYIGANCRLAAARLRLLLSTSAAEAAHRALHQAAGRFDLCRRRRSAVLPAVGIRQAAGAGDRRAASGRHLCHNHAAGRSDRDPDPPPSR